MRRLFGLETEYGLAAREGDECEGAFSGADGNAQAVERANMQSWSMAPVLERLRWRLQYRDFEMMTALFRIVSGEGDSRELNCNTWWAGA